MCVREKEIPCCVQPFLPHTPHSTFCNIFHCNEGWSRPQECTLYTHYSLSPCQGSYGPTSAMGSRNFRAFPLVTYLVLASSPLTMHRPNTSISLTMHVSTTPISSPVLLSHIRLNICPVRSIFSDWDVSCSQTCFQVELILVRPCSWQGPAWVVFSSCVPLLCLRTKSSTILGQSAVFIWIAPPTPFSCLWLSLPGFSRRDIQAAAPHTVEGRVSLCSILAVTFLTDRRSQPC